MLLQVARAILCGAALGASIAYPLLAAAVYPERPIRVVVAYAPGGNIDLNARTVAPGLSADLGQPVVVENRAGAGSRIGTEYAAKQPADGYTLLLGSTAAMTINPVFGTNI